jgi:hypothetical protein
MVVHGQRELPCDFDIVREGFHVIRSEPQVASLIRLDDGGSWRDGGAHDVRWLRAPVPHIIRQAYLYPHRHLFVLRCPNNAV